MNQEEILAKIGDFEKETKKMAIFSFVIFLSFLLLLLLVSNFFVPQDSNFAQTLLLVVILVFIPGFIVSLSLMHKSKAKQLGLLCKDCKSYFGGKHLEETLKGGKCFKCGTQLFEFDN